MRNPTLKLLVPLLVLAGFAPAAPAQVITRAKHETRPEVEAEDFELPRAGGGTFRLFQECERAVVVLVWVRGMW